MLAARHPRPFPFVALGMLALFAALWGGLLRLGWAFSPMLPTSVIFHGPLMVGSFVGTLIGLERALALGRKRAYAVPLLAGLGGLALLAGSPMWTGGLLLSLSSGGLLAIYVTIARQHRSLHLVIMALGAASWLVGNVLWLAGWPVARLVLWWAGFLVLTVAGERLEMSRLMSISRGAQLAFRSSLGGFVVGTALSGIVPEVGWRVAGLGLVGLAVWLARHDVARRTVRQPGLTRFVAVCLLAGYVWLGVSGALALVFGGPSGGYQYDAFLHALFLGFVVSLIFGHAPIVMPAVLGRLLGFHAGFYAHLALLHASLLLRVASDEAAWLPGRQWGGLLNVIAVILFVGITVRGVAAGLPDRATQARSSRSDREPLGTTRS